MIVGEFGPIFPLRSVLREMGFPATTARDVAPESSRFDVGEASAIEDVWRAIDPLLLALALAGYECRRVVIGQAERGEHVDGFLTLDPLLQGATYAPGDWPTITGVPLGSDWFTAVLVRVTPRRTYGEPSFYAPVSLSGVASFIPFKEPVTVDPFVADEDGWIVLSSSVATWGPLHFLAAQADAARDEVVDTLATAWETGRDDEGAAGLLYTLDARSWEAAHDVGMPITWFRHIGTGIWEYLQQYGVMRTFLSLPPGHPAATLEGLLIVIGLHAWLPLAMEELTDRQHVLQPRNASLPPLLRRLRSLHWLTVLLVLQEYGLVRTLPFPLPYEVGIPYCDLTGWYETESGVAPVRCLQLNQAAVQFDGWWQDDQLVRWGVERAPEANDESGPYNTNPGFVGYTLMLTLLEGDQPSADAMIDGIPLVDDPEQDLVLTVRFQGETYRLVRRDRLARLAPEIRLREAPTVSRPMGEAMLARLHLDSETGLLAAIGVLVAEIQRIDAGSDFDWNVQIVTLEERFREALQDNGIYSYTGLDIEETPMLLRLRAQVRIVLPGHTAGDRDAFQKLLQILAVAESVTTDADGMNAAATVRALLGIPDDLHQYSFRFTGYGAISELKVLGGAAGGGLLLEGPISHVPTCPQRPLDTEPNWTCTYIGRLLQVGLGLAVGVIMKIDFVDINLTSNDLFAPTEWHPDHFGGDLLSFPPPLPGRCVFIQGTLSRSIGAAALPAQETGREILEGYTFLTTLGWSVASGSGDGYYIASGVGLGGELAGSYDVAIGAIDYRLSCEGDPPVDIPVPDTPVVAAVEGVGEACFLVGNHVLSDRGRKTLAAMVARHRALFECPGSVMILEGDASPTGTESFNEQLSWRRAKSVYSWIRSALTSARKGCTGEACALAIAEGRVQMFGYGEMHARLEGIADGVEADEWRMAKLTVNNSELLLL